jgi:peptide-methionine (R)-S-oxide reductase
MLKWSDIIQFAAKGNPTPESRIEKSPEEWRKELTEEQFMVTRLKGTERPFSGEYCSSYQAGKYACVCCGALLFDSGLKFDSGTGWPSFTQPAAENAISYHRDSSHGMVRVEVLCNSCDSHLGHVFPDGPPPGGLRYCINSVSLVKVNSADQDDHI